MDWASCLPGNWASTIAEGKTRLGTTTFHQQRRKRTWSSWIANSSTLMTQKPPGAGLGQGHVIARRPPTAAWGIPVCDAPLLGTVSDKRGVSAVRALYVDHGASAGGGRQIPHGGCRRSGASHPQRCPQNRLEPRSHCGCSGRRREASPDGLSLLCQAPVPSGAKQRSRLPELKRASADVKPSLNSTVSPPASLRVEGQASQLHGVSEGSRDAGAQPRPWRRPGDAGHSGWTGSHAESLEANPRHFLRQASRPGFHASRAPPNSGSANGPSAPRVTLCVMLETASQPASQPARP